MYKLAKPFFLIVETPLHAGSGSDLGVVDLPIQREKPTGFPKIESSGLKGCIRDAFETARRTTTVGTQTIQTSDKATIDRAFGPETGGDHAGALGFSDARLLLFPVKSMKGVFAWITCPQVLERLRTDLGLAGVEGISIPKENTIPVNSQLPIKGDRIVLEEYTFNVKKDQNSSDPCSVFANWLSTNVFPQGNEYGYWREKMKKDLVVLSDDDFGDFVHLSTEVITRIKINNETGTVQDGALFTEEYLPSETILYSLALTTPVFRDDNDKGVFKQNQGIKEEELVMDYFVDGLPEVLQIGGNATIGKGIVRTRVWG
ncbi:MAG: RAMP superfamily protein [Thermotogae bacterium ADurb.Bin062]|nr:MAG: RAMP superfamily protein [Thermotogota bacterium ADurb.Bin062]